MPQKNKSNKESDIERKPLPKVTFNEYELITLEENNILKIKNDNLIQRLLNSSKLIKDAEIAVQQKISTERELAEWKAYLACDKFPKPFEPEEVRKFFIKTRHFEKEDKELTANWLLAVDERSILNQDIDSPYFTHRYLKEAKIDFGVQYDARVNEALEVLRRIQEFLEKPIVQLTKRILNDIIEVKFLAFKEINHHIDNLTYRVLSSEAAYMNTVDVTTAEYSYGATHFDIHLWTFKNVPIYLDPIDTPHIAIDLAKIKINLVLPFSVLCENLVIRGLHCYFDHFSARTRYFELPSVIDDEPDLISCLNKEWDIQKKIQIEVREMLTKQRAVFDEEMRLKAEEEELIAKLSKQQERQSKGLPKKKTEKPKKQSKEPQILTPDLVPSIRSDFFQYDNAYHEEIMKSFHPDMLALSNGEVNLRKFQILGGVYHLNSLSKPKIANLPKLIMGWYTSSQKIESQDLRTQLEKPNSSDTSISKFFQISFELPEHFCRWGEPIPCLFEEGESYTSEEAVCCETAKTLNISSPVIVSDFNLHQLFTKPLMYTFIENCIPRTISSFKFPEDLVNEEEDEKAKVALDRAKLTAEEQRKEDELIRQKQLLSFDVQKSPERLFPIFKKVFPVVILPIQEEQRDEKSHAYEYFSDFLSALEVIKESYRATTFKDKYGKPIKIMAEMYDKNTRKPRKDLHSSRFLLFDKTEEIKFSSESLRENFQDLVKSGNEENARIEIAKKPKKMRPAADNKNKNKDSESEHIVEKGIFGFALYRYQHFPFQNWSLQPNKENPEEIELTIESMFAVFRIYITPRGYKASITDFSKFYKSRKVYLEISEPITDIKILKEKLQQKFLNIFPERDAVWYMSGYFSEKHRSAEYHTYNCMSLYTAGLKFSTSIWNKLSNRRTMVLKFGELRDLENDMLELRISPEDVMFVEVQEVCTDLETIELQYKPTWRNLEWYPDLNHLIISTFNDAEDMRLKNPNTICYLKNLLYATRPLSCS